MLSEVTKTFLALKRTVECSGAGGTMMQTKWCISVLSSKCGNLKKSSGVWGQH
jgi:hypothetical protein